MVLLAGSAMMALAAADMPAQEGPPTENLALWLKAGAGVEIDGERVVRWADQSGHGNDARGESATGPVLVESAINARPAVRFDGVGSHLVVGHYPDLNAGNGFSVICVFRYAGGFRIAQKKSRAGGLSPDAWFLTPSGGLGVSGKYVGGSRFLRNRPHLQSSVFDGESRTIRVFSLGEQVALLSDVPPQQPNEDPIYIGRRLNPGGTEGHFRGELAELLIYSTALSDDARQRVEGYLREMYDIRPPEKPAIYVTRVIPRHEQVTVEWNEPGGELAGAELRYRVDIKLREASWEDAHRVELPGDAGSATIPGLLNQADYNLRVVALRPGADRPVGFSAERTLTPGAVPGVVIDYLHREDTAYEGRGQYIGSPSIARLDDGALIAGHDLFGVGTDDLSRVFRSDDGGETWQHLTDVEPAFWGKVFVHRGELYLLATRSQYGDLLLHHLPDGGDSWQKPAVIAPGRYHKAPVPLTEHDGKLWTCVELQTGDWPAGFQAVACSAPVDADLMDPANWTVSEPLPYDPAWLPEGWGVPVERQGYLEGNAVVDPSGRLLNILRHNTAPHYRKAVALNIAEDGKSLSFNRLIDFYGGMTKFTIRRDPRTGIYWSLVNRVTIPTAAGMRSVLSLVSSPDLDNWAVHGDILRDDSPWAVKYTGFQYVDWLFDGDDIIVASRTAFNGAHNFHDANYLTFHRVKDFAKGVPMVKP